jgi:hypothetical protein
MIQVGDTVRVLDPDGFIAAFASKVRDRDGVVESVFTRQGGSSLSVRVRFLKRNGRGKEFTHILRPMDLVVTQAAAVN